ncbi:MAG: glycosyltransferase, partial [Vicinamibacterales bacterium]
MHIAYVCTDPGVPVFGRKGCSIHVQEILRAFRKHGARVTVFAARTDGTPPADLHDLALHRLPIWAETDRRARATSARAANFALRLLLDRAGPFDLIYERYSLWSIGAMDYARSSGTAGLLEINASLIDEEVRYRGLTDSASAMRSTRQSFSTATILIVVSDSLTAYVKQYRNRDDGVHVVPNGVDPARFPPGLAPSLPAKDGAFTVGFLGSFKPWHGLMTLVEAFGRLHRSASNTRLLIVGDGPEREPVSAYLSTHKLLGATTFTGAVESTDVPGLLASMDVGTAPYSNRPDFYFSPLKVYEYMAAGLAVVASDLG